jgi:cryptochrome
MYWILPSLVAVLMSSSSTTTMKKPMVAMHWFRKGLRLHDNPGLAFSSQKDKGVSSKLYPVYVMDGDCYQIKHCTALRANFLVECLQDLDENLRKRGSRLYVASGDPVTILPTLWNRWGITHMTFEEDETGEPYAKERDEKVMRQAQECGIQVQMFASETLHPLQKYVDKSPAKAPNTMGAFEKIFGGMGRVPKPKDAPSELPPSDDADVTTLLPPKNPTDLPWPRNTPRDKVTPVWGVNDCQTFTSIVRGGETQALKQLDKKVTRQPTYVATFEKPKTSCVATEEASTTALSPYMSLGCLSPRTFWYAIEESSQRSNVTTKSKPPVSLHGQLLWRDFNNLMAHTANKNQPGSWGQIQGNTHCRPIPWSEDPELLQAWKEARTGYPWIDACMKQLEQEGWIHHLGRHAVACFLTRGDLWQNWEKGALHFESQLLDADYALNGFNWLWLSCSGFFYQYFRCYSPIVFQKKNDPNGNYIRKYLPELRELPAKYIYEPWKAPILVQQQAGVRIGKDYPKPIVDHAYASKENMSKMALAYDAYKESQKVGGTKEADAKKRTANGATKKAPPKKRQKKLTDY